ncbi:MAG: sigma 54-interacting transcriptional regulator [Clostridia bacterium]|nr:sigma 54-interacting transcriptional regulator [Clostridia bacterium]
MGTIYHSKSNAYLNLDPMLLNFMEIMNNYSKPVLMKEHLTEDYYLNELAAKVFAFPVEENYVLDFISKIKFSGFTEAKSQQAVVLEVLNLDIKASLKQIIEDNMTKYTLCTLEELKSLTIKTQIPQPKEAVLKDIIGDSEDIQYLKDKIRKVAKTNSSILLVGETGAGKEMFAKAIHRMSDRREKPFVAINCGAIPDTLIESELFGYERGAFTGANQQGKIGKFEQASGGTIFLDEVENMSMLLQMKLLRVLEDRKVMRVGGNHEIPIDVRIVSATNNNLAHMIQADAFRLDLYYRLNIVKLKIPSLKERKDDILQLSQHFIKIFSIAMHKEIVDLSSEVKDIFMGHSWKGNVRELRNTIEYAMNFEESNIITKQSLPEQFSCTSLELVKDIEFKPMAEIERAYIEEALNYYGWDDKGRLKAAEVLGISRSSIYRKISSR